MLKKLVLIAIDEISIGRGHRYLTVVLDLKTGAVVFVGDGKGADALKPFWKRWKMSRAKNDAVAMDMSPSDISAVTKNLPEAAIVFDHFHVIKCLTITSQICAVNNIMRHQKKNKEFSKEHAGCF